MLRAKPRILRPKQDSPLTPPTSQPLLLLLPAKNSFILNQDQLFNVVNEPVNLAENPRKQYFRSVKGYVSDKKDVGEICRTCYRAVFNHHSVKLFDDSNQDTCEKIRLMLKQVIPGINLDVYANPIICMKCVKSLFDSYGFKTKCEETEEKFHNWIGQRQSVQNDEVNLLILVESSTNGDEASMVSNHTQTDPENDLTTSAEVGEDELPNCINEDFSIFMDHDYANPRMVPKSKKQFSCKKKLNEKKVKAKDKFASPLLCELCGAFVKNYRAFMVHSRSHLNYEFKAGLHKCRDCNYVPKNRFDLKQHARKHLKPIHQCQECGKRYKCPQALQSHARNIHMGLNNTVQCHICGKEFKYGTSLRIHLISHNPDGHLKYMCEVCGKRFATRSHYTHHVISHETTIFSCDICGKKVKRKENLQRHREIFHENKGKYRCVVCGKSYWKEDDLTRHKIRIHESGNDIKCDICEIYFTTQTKCRVHMATCHKKVFECEICGKNLKRAQSVKTHYEIFHGDRGKFKCEVCDRGFWKEEDLLKHEFKMHQIEAKEDDLDLIELDTKTDIVEFDMDKENFLVEHNLESLF